MFSIDRLSESSAAGTNHVADGYFAFCFGMLQMIIMVIMVEKKNFY